MGFFIFFALPVAYETLPSAASISADWSPEAGSAFLAALQVAYQSSLQYPVMRYPTIGIQQVASSLGFALPGGVEEIFAKIKQSIADDTKREKEKSDWVIKFNTANSDVHGSRLNNLIKELDKLGINNYA